MICWLMKQRARDSCRTGDGKCRPEMGSAVPVGLPDAQQLLVIDKDMNGKVRTKEIMQVLFSLLEGPDETVVRAS
jgi:hypothetical protein